MCYGIVRTVVAGLVGGLRFVLGVFLTFAQLGGSRRGETGLLFDPATQSPQVIAVWKEIEPLPRTLETPAVIVSGLVLFGLAYAFVYCSVAPSSHELREHSRNPYDEREPPRPAPSREPTRLAPGYQPS
jgi:hypothetical protein